MNLSFDFKSTIVDFQLDAKADITDQGVTAIFGPSGCGKTSLLRFIAGLDRADHGLLNFKESVWQSDSIWLQPWKRPVAYVFQQPSLFEHLDVQRNLDFAAKRAIKSNVSLSQQRLIEIFDLTKLLDRSVNSLSGGEQQRVAIARALCSSPQLLLMDEPLTALDEDSKKQILPYLESLCVESKVPIIYVSHSVSEVARLADSILLMNQGAIEAHGPTAQILNRIGLFGGSLDDIDNLVLARLVSHDAAYGLSILESDLGQFSVATLDKKIGSSVRLIVSARDISLTLERQQDTSILNIFSAQVEQLQELDDTLMLVKLCANNSSVLAKITRKSAHNLQLKLGLKVYCQAKTVSLL